jgi:hypothetical protein
MTEELVFKVLSIILTVIIAFLGWKMQRKTERIKIMEGQLSEKRYFAYAKLYDFFYEMFKGVKDAKSTNNKEMRNKLLDAKKELIMYGTDDVVFALNNYLSSLTNDSPYYQLDRFLDVMVLIRKDMCGKTKIDRDAILLNIMQDKSELQKFKDMLK